jgi:rRNA processing protein Krr1/Pno1
MDMKNAIKLEMKKKAHMIRGLSTLLKDDADYICVDAEDFDLIGLEESVREIKETIQQLVDNIMEIEYSLYLAKRTTSRK